MADKKHEPLLPPLPAPPQPTVASQYEWDLLSDEAKAQALFAWSGFWFGRSTPAVAPTSSGSRIVISDSLINGEPLIDEWKGIPSAEEIASMKDETWRKY